MDITIPNRQRSGAMALLEKYEILTKGIQNARDEIMKESSALENIQQSITQSKVERSEMIVKEQELEVEIKSLEQERRSVSKEFQTLMSQEGALKQKKESLEEDLKLLQTCIKEERQDFLSRSRDFRSFCRRSKLELLSLPSLPGEEDEGLAEDKNGTERITTLDGNFGFGKLLHSSSSEDDDSSGESEEELLDLQINSISLPQTHPTDNEIINEHEVFDSEDEMASTLSLSVACSVWNKEHSVKHDQGLNDNCDALKLSRKRKRRHAHRKGTKPKSPKLNKDEELEQAKARHLESVREREATTQDLKNVKFDYEAASRRAEDRSEKLEQQRDQLKRVRRDVQEMENELVELEVNTREIGDMRDGYIKAMESRGDISQNTTATPHNQTKDFHKKPNCFSITPSPHIVTNRNSSQSGTPINPYIKKKLKSDQLIINKGIQRNQSNLRRQYPHRAGRIKVDRQFTTPLSIGDGNIAADGEESVDIEVNKRHKTCISSSDDSDDDDLLSFTPFDNSLNDGLQDKK